MQAQGSVVPIVLWLIDAYGYLARVQSRLERHMEAWTTLMQALSVLQSPAVINAFASLDASPTSTR